MAVCDEVVVGSYPPAPGPATAAVLAAVRRAWDAGWAVRVVSYRSGAADQVVPVAGPLAGWRLEQVRRHYDGPPQVVLVLQRGVPFCDMRPAQQLATAAGLVWGFRKYQIATLVVGEDPGILRICMRLLAGAAAKVVAPTQELADRLTGHYKLASSCVVLEENGTGYPAVPQGIEPSALGLFRPGAAHSISVVDMPATTLGQRVRARAVSSKSVITRRLRGR